MGMPTMESDLVVPTKVEATHVAYNPVIPHLRVFCDGMFQTMVLRAGKSI